LYVGVSSYQELTQKGFPDQSSTAVASTLRLPARSVAAKIGSPLESDLYFLQLQKGPTDLFKGFLGNT
jgi:hypothetical protein